MEADLLDSSLSSSNLKKALKMSSHLSDLWVSGDLEQKGRIQNLVFPSGIGYNKLNGGVQTIRVNAIFSSIPLLTKDLSKIKAENLLIIINSPLE